MSKQWKDRLQRQNQLFDAALSNMLHGLCMFDAEARLILCNAAYASMYDLPERLTREGTPLADILDFRRAHGSAPADMSTYFDIRIESETSHQPTEANVLLDDGRIVKISHSSMENLAYVATHQDVTEKMRLIEELARNGDMLEAKVQQRTEEVQRQAKALERLLDQERAINDLQRQFVAMASHEFRTPLTVIDGAAQRLIRHRDRADAAFTLEKAEQIRASVVRILTLMESILSSGRYDAGMGDLTYEPVDPAALLRACCKRQADIAPTHKFDLDLTALPPKIDADRSALDQVFTNLLSNAVKYSKGAPNINVRAWQDGDTVRIAVRDEGLGIDAEDVPKLFQRYYRARTSTGIAGTGIGLHLVKQIVEMHRGKIEVTSARAQGSTFTVSLPAKQHAIHERHHAEQGSL